MQIIRVHKYTAVFFFSKKKEKKSVSVKEGATNQKIKSEKREREREKKSETKQIKTDKGGEKKKQNDWLI